MEDLQNSDQASDVLEGRHIMGFKREETDWGVREEDAVMDMQIDTNDIHENYMT